MVAILVALSLALSASALPAYDLHEPIVTSTVLRRTSGTKGNRTSSWALKQASSLRNKYHVGGASTPLDRRQDANRGVGSSSLVNVNADSSYYGQLLVGTPPQPMNVILDTGSSDMWLASGACQTCSDVPRFDETLSSSYVATDTPFSIQYGSGAAAGVMGSDVVQMNSLFEVPNQAFAIADRVSAGLLDNDISGLLGLGFGSISSSQTTPFAQTLAERGGLREPLFGFFLTRFLDVLRTGDQIAQYGGEFTLGGTNSALYDGEIEFIDIPAGREGFWKLDMSTLIVNGVEIPIPASETGSAIDTGTTLFGGPAELIAAIYSQVPGAVRGVDDFEGFWQYPCTSPVVVSVAFGPKGQHTQYTIDPADVELMRVSRNVCVGAFFEIDLGTNPENPAWIVGDTFLKSVYSVFRFSPPSVGFAPLSDFAKKFNGVKGQALPTATAAADPIRVTAVSIPGGTLSTNRDGADAAPRTVASSLAGLVFALCVGALLL